MNGTNQSKADCPSNAEVHINSESVDCGGEEESSQNEENRKTEEGMEGEVGERPTGTEVDHNELEAQTNSRKNGESEDSLDRDQAQIIIGAEGTKVVFTKVKQQRNSAKAQEGENMESTVNSRNRRKPKDGDEKSQSDVEAQLTVEGH